MAGDPSRRPSVSVVIPVWNVEPYLRQCLDSVLGQTIGLERLELIAVDDGSTDASGSILDEYAAGHASVTVVHDENSGGPGRPRNLGLDRARGTYVFFLDADDYLGPECLERLVAMAERAGSDIVLGKLVGVEGRRTYSDVGVFRRTLDRAPLAVAYQSGNVLKLFRRSFLERTGLRFREDVPGGEDGDFMARLYVEAGTVSIVADYDCYFARGRSGSQTRRADRGDDLGDYLVRLERERIEVLAARRRPGAARDRLMRRHIRKVARLFGARWPSLVPEDRRRVFGIGAAIVRRWSTPRLQRSLPAWAAVRIWCLHHGRMAELEEIVAVPSREAFGEPRVERGRLFARYPHFRDGSGIPDRCFDFTREVRLQQRLQRSTLSDGRLELAGTAYLTLVGGSTAVELRRLPRGGTWRFEAEAVATPELRDMVVAYPNAGFRAAIDLGTAAGGAALPPGTWDVRLSVGTNRVRQVEPVRVARRGRRGPHGSRPQEVVEGRGLYVTRAQTLRLTIGPRSRAVAVFERLEPSYRRVMRRARSAAARVRGAIASRAGRG